MKQARYIGILTLIFCASMIHGQQVLDTVCINGSPTHLALPYQKGLSYQWSVNGGQIIGRADSNDVEVDWGNVPGIFKSSVAVWDERGCSDTLHAWMMLQGPVNAHAKGPAILCEGEIVTLESSLNSNFKWGNGSTQQSISFVAAEDTTILLISLNSSCGNDTFFHQVQVVDVPVSSISFIEDTLLLNDIRRLYYLGSPTDQIEWYLNGQGVSQTNSLLLNFDGKGAYEIMQVVINGSNCTDTIKKTVYVEDEFAVFIPNAFSPNGDQINDYFEFDGVGIKKFTAVLYNRWGEKVHIFTEKSSHGWDGTNHGEPSKMDTYTYDIVVESYGGKVIHEKGKFTLIR